MTAVWFRRKVIVNTDSQRRCYNGCNFSEVEMWSEWKFIARYLTREAAEQAAGTFKTTNPRWEYEVRDEQPS